MDLVLRIQIGNLATQRRRRSLRLAGIYDGFSASYSNWKFGITQA